MTRARSETGRRKGNIEERGGALRVRVFAGYDPVTGKQSYLRALIKGNDEAAWREAENKLTEFRAQVLKQRHTASSAPFAQAVTEWLATSEIEDSTLDSYVNYIKRYIVPALGNVGVRKINARTLERFYTDLRRCRTQCDGKPFVEHTTEHDHDGAHLDRWRGHALVKLGESEAVTILADALDRLDPHFIRVETALRVDLATVLFTIGNSGEARMQAEHAAQSADDIGSARQLSRIRRLGARHGYAACEGRLS